MVTERWSLRISYLEVLPSLALPDLSEIPGIFNRSGQGNPMFTPLTPDRFSSSSVSFTDRKVVPWVGLVGRTSRHIRHDHPDVLTLTDGTGK